MAIQPTCTHQGECKLDVYLQYIKGLIQSDISPFILTCQFSRLRKAIASCPHQFRMPDLELIRWLDEREALLGFFLPFSTPEELEETCKVLNFFQPFSLEHLKGEEEFVSALMGMPDCLKLLDYYSLSWISRVRDRLYSKPSPITMASPSIYIFQLDQEQR